MLVMEVERINPWMQVGVLCESNTVHETRLYSGLPTTTANQSTIKNNKTKQKRNPKNNKINKQKKQ